MSGIHVPEPLAQEDIQLRTADAWTAVTNCCLHGLVLVMTDLVLYECAELVVGAITRGSIGHWDGAVVFTAVIAAFHRDTDLGGNEQLVKLLVLESGLAGPRRKVSAGESVSCWPLRYYLLYFPHLGEGGSAKQEVWNGTNSEIP